MISVATLFTIARILLVPIIIYSINQALYNYGFILFLIAALTDIIDGFIARRFNQITPFGTLLDPIADKLLIIGCLVSLWINTFLIPTWFLVALLTKELLLIVGGFSVLRWVPGVDLKADNVGKIAMLLQVVFVGALLSCAITGAEIPHVVMYIVICVNASALTSYAVRIKNVQRVLPR